MASASTTEITAAFESQSDPYKSLLQAKKYRKSCEAVKVPNFFVSRPLECRPCME